MIEVFEHSPPSFFSPLLAKLYALFTLNFPLATAVHTSLSVGSVVPKGTLSMEFAIF